MPFVIEGETADGDYFTVEDIESWDDLQLWIEEIVDEGIIDYEWDYEEAT